MTERAKAFFMNGGAGRVLSSIPAFEKYAEEVSKDFIIVCEGGTDFYKGHPLLHERAYDHWHKNLFEDKLINMDIVTPEPYRIWEYYNQKCSIAQAFDIEINKKGIRDLPRPTLKLSNEEILAGRSLIQEVKQKTKKEKVIIFQPFGRGVQNKEGIIYDPSGRSFESTHMVNVIRKLQKHFAVILMTEFGMDLQSHGLKDPLAQPMNLPIRFWAGAIMQADYFLGCDSAGQHIAYALNKPSTVVLGSTFDINVSYPAADNFDVLDLGGDRRRYSPIRVTMDEVADRGNDGIMAMNDKVEDAIIDSVLKNSRKFKNLWPVPAPLVQVTSEPPKCC
jgi:hypothetical protein